MKILAENSRRDILLITSITELLFQRGQGIANRFKRHLPFQLL